MLRFVVAPRYSPPTILFKSQLGGCDSLRPSVTLVAQSRKIFFFFSSLSPCSRVRVYSDACDRHAAASLIPQCQTTTTGERSMHLFPLSAYRMNERIRDDDNEKDRTCPTGGRGVDLRAGL